MTTGAVASPSLLGIMLVDDAHHRLLAGFTLAAGGLAMGRTVRIFATGPALVALRADYAPAKDGKLEQTGAAGVVTLRSACMSLDARIFACDSAMIAAGLDVAQLCEGVVISGIPAFLEGGLTPAVF